MRLLWYFWWLFKFHLLSGCYRCLLRRGGGGGERPLLNLSYFSQYGGSLASAFLCTSWCVPLCRFLALSQEGRSQRGGLRWCLPFGSVYLANPATRSNLLSVFGRQWWNMRRRRLVGVVLHLWRNLFLGIGWRSRNLVLQLLPSSTKRSWNDQLPNPPWGGLVLICISVYDRRSHFWWSHFRWSHFRWRDFRWRYLLLGSSGTLALLLLPWLPTWWRLLVHFPFWFLVWC